MTKIVDGTGGGWEAKVTSENKLAAIAVTVPPQMHLSARHQQAFQVLSGVQSITGANGLLAIRNDSAKRLVVTYIRVACDDTETAQALVEIYLGGTWTGGGTALTPVNLNLTSAAQAGVTAETNSLPGGTPSLIDARWLRGPGEVTYNKEGSIILGTNNVFSIKVTPETAAVGFNARLSFLMIDEAELVSF
jgi:hypothetical protein